MYTSGEVMIMSTTARTNSKFKHQVTLINNTPNAQLLKAMEETEQVVKEYASGIRKPEPFNNVHDLIQNILDEEDA